MHVIISNSHLSNLNITSLVILACNYGEACSVGSVQSTVTIADHKGVQHTTTGGILQQA